MRQTPHAGAKGGPAYGAVPGGDANGFSTGMMYDSMPMGSWAENPISDTLKKFFDVSSYEKTAFNIIRASLLTGRSMVLGGRSAQGEPVPSKPWMVSCHDIAAVWVAFF